MRIYLPKEMIYRDYQHSGLLFQYNLTRGDRFTRHQKLHVYSMIGYLWQIHEWFFLLKERVTVIISMNDDGWQKKLSDRINLYERFVSDWNQSEGKTTTEWK